ncbi:MAG: hypothetical protein GX221_05035 [Candidatus Riflebacteria bacterium]|nr:hypothetical protein [Candidatus Riflebacteria bacterium]
MNRQKAAKTGGLSLYSIYNQKIANFNYFGNRQTVASFISIINMYIRLSGFKKSLHNWRYKKMFRISNKITLATTFLLAFSIIFTPFSYELYAQKV